MSLVAQPERSSDRGRWVLGTCTVADLRTNYRGGWFRGLAGAGASAAPVSRCSHHGVRALGWCAVPGLRGGPGLCVFEVQAVLGNRSFRSPAVSGAPRVREHVIGLSTEEEGEAVGCFGCLGCVGYRRNLQEAALGFRRRRGILHGCLGPGWSCARDRRRRRPACQEGAQKNQE